MSDQPSADVVREYIERVWNEGDTEALVALTAPDFAYCLGGQAPLDRAAFRDFLAATRAAFPDWRVSVVDLVAGADAVAVRWKGLATHAGTFRGIPPTGTRIRVSGINFYRLAGERIAGEWEQMDSLGLLQQIGAMPTSRG